MTNGSKVVKEYRYRGLKGGAVIGFFVGLLLVVQTFEPGLFDFKRFLIWTSVTSIIFALIGWLIYGGTAGLTGYDDSDYTGGGSDGSGGDGGCGGD